MVTIAELSEILQLALVSVAIQETQETGYAIFALISNVRAKRLIVRQPCAQMAFKTTFLKLPSQVSFPSNS